jgi:hypothetical protein
MMMGCTFLNASTAHKAKIASDTYKLTLVNIAALQPVGASTVPAISSAAAAIRPTTAGLSPLIQPLTARLFLNLETR